jgi:hypothetical protein
MMMTRRGHFAMGMESKEYPKRFWIPRNIILPHATHTTHATTLELQGSVRTLTTRHPSRTLSSLCD